jgi:ribose transport system substrate-binding protein
MPERRRYLFFAVALFVVVAAVFAIASRLRLREHPVVAVIPETTAEELWEGEHAGVALAVKGTKWRIYWNGPSSEDQIAQQIALVQHIDALHASGLILAPDHPLALTTVVRHVLSRGIPTVIVSTELPLYPHSNLGFVLNDDQAAGALAADYVAHLLHGHGTVALFGDNPDIRSATMRASAFAQTVALRYPDIHLAAQPRGSLRLGQAEQQTEDVLRANPHLAAIVSIGIIQTRGTLIALRSLKQQDKVALISFDQDLDLMYSLRHGEIDAVIVQNTFRMGEIAMQMIENAHHGSPIPPMTRVAPLLITRANIDSPEAQRVLSVDWRP